MTHTESLELNSLSIPLSYRIGQTFQQMSRNGRPVPSSGYTINVYFGLIWYQLNNSGLGRGNSD